jgi:hypothetical protein
MSRGRLALYLVVLATLYGCSGHARDHALTGPGAQPTATPASTPPAAPGRPWADAAAATMVAVPAPRSAAIANAVDLYGAGGDTVLAATRNGISRSRDGGRRWRNVLRGYPMAAVSHGPTGYFALGGTRNGRRYVTATSPNGIDWSVVTAHTRRENTSFASAFGSAAVLDGPVAVEVTTQNRLVGPDQMMRTTDAGHHWRPVRAMREAEGGLQLRQDGSLVATARGAERDCGGAVWQSDDVGAS